MRPRLLGLAGTSGAGKDTVADYLEKKYWYRPERMMAPLRPVARAIKLLPDYADWELWKKVRPEFNEHLYRLGQAIQKEFRAPDGTDPFVTAIERRLGPNHPPTVIVDVRQEIYQDWVRSRGGVIVWVDRVVSSGRSIDRDLDHLRARADYILPNHGTLPQLHDNVDMMMRGWESSA